MPGSLPSTGVPGDPMAGWPPERIAAAYTDPVSGRDVLRAVDMHVHYVPAEYRRLAVRAGWERPDGHVGGLPEWRAAEHLEVLDEWGIATAIVSISTPGVQLTDDPADGRAIARAANEGGAEAARDYPDRFGFFASLPLPDIDGALAEISYAFDVLGAAGVSLMTHESGVYLGDRRLDPVFAELGRRNALVRLHPRSPAALVPGVMDGWSRSMYEYFFDTTRTVLNLIFSGTLRRNPGIDLIVPHAGVALPILAQRVARNVWRTNALATDHQGEPLTEPLPDFLESLRGLYYDLAGSVLPHQLPGLLTLVGPDRLLFGSDWPFTHTGLGAELGAQLRATSVLDEEQRRAVFTGNALRLLEARR